MIHEFDIVALTTDLPESGLLAGAEGTVMLIHDAVAGLPPACEVEFPCLWKTPKLAVVTVELSRLRLVEAYKPPARTGKRDHAGAAV
jgi:hypothetical protein